MYINQANTDQDKRTTKAKRYTALYQRQQEINSEKPKTSQPGSKKNHQETLCTGHSFLLSNHSTIHRLWNLHKHSSRTSGCPTSYSSMQIVHSCAPASWFRQSFSVAVNATIRTGSAGGCAGLPPAPAPVSACEEDRIRGPWFSMQSRICASRGPSLPSSPRGGNWELQMGHMSRSLTRREGREGRVHEGDTLSSGRCVASRMALS